MRRRLASGLAFVVAKGGGVLVSAWILASQVAHLDSPCLHAGARQSGHLIMWEPIVQQIRELQGLDRQLQNFGAEVHHYQLCPCLGAEALVEIEHALTVELPKELRLFYLEAGNGIAGPDFGLSSAEDLYANTDEAFPGVKALHKAALAAGLEDISAAEGLVPEDGLPGVVTLMDCGCGQTKSMVVEGPEAGRILWVEDDTFVALKETFYELYEAWLCDSLAQFRGVEQLMHSVASYAEIAARFEELFPESPNHAGSLISSLANAQKPPQLFGAPSEQRIIVSGREQDAWFVHVLMDWQRGKLGAHSAS